MRLYRHVVEKSLEVEKEKDSNRETKMLHYVLTGAHTAIVDKGSKEEVLAWLKGFENSKTAQKINFVIENYKD